MPLRKRASAGALVVRQSCLPGRRVRLCWPERGGAAQAPRNGGRDPQDVQGAAQAAAQVGRVWCGRHAASGRDAALPPGLGQLLSVNIYTKFNLEFEGCTLSTARVL